MTVERTRWMRWRIALFVLLIAIQASAAGLVAASGPHEGKDVATTAVWLALIVTLATGARELTRDMTGPDSTAAKEVRKAHYLLDFLVDRFPALMNTLAVAAAAPSGEVRAGHVARLQAAVSGEASQLIPEKTLRAAQFQISGDGIVPPGLCPGWSERPRCPERAVVVILQTLREEICAKVWSPDITHERSFETLAFKLSDKCASLVAVPIRSLWGLTGFLYVESDEKVIDERVANLIVGLGQLLAVAESLNGRAEPAHAQTMNAAMTATRSRKA